MNAAPCSGCQARQWRPVLHDVAHRPEHAAFVGRPVDIVVRAEDIEVAGFDPCQHELDRLLRCPGRRRLLDAAVGGEPGEHEARDQQVRADLAALHVAQLVLQRLREHLHRRLRHVCRRHCLAAWVMPCLEPVLTTSAGRPCAIIAGTKACVPCTTPPHVDVDDAGPRHGGRLGCLPADGGAGGLDAGIVHQHVGRAEPLKHGVANALDLVQASHIGGDRQDVGGLRQVVGRRLQPGRLQVDQAELHSPAGIPSRGGKADTGGAPGDDGDAGGGKGRMRHGGNPAANGSGGGEGPPAPCLRGGSGPTAPYPMVERAAAHAA